ncbi:hypothetical protein SO802_030077 [Lithocarpus litseifolius]|uniref:Uncharacterized protein n=1 Tax=Lithocarpus litseifolius TaxID=425828 RepID=A0AAW2BX38_9ROSI
MIIINKGLQLSTVKVSPSVEHLGVRSGLSQRALRGLVAFKYTDIKPLGDRVLVKIKTAEEKTDGGILVLTTAQTKPQGDEVVATREGKTVGKSKLYISVKVSFAQLFSIVCSFH